MSELHTEQRHAPRTAALLAHLGEAASAGSMAAFKLYANNFGGYAISKAVPDMFRNVSTALDNVAGKLFDAAESLTPPSDAHQASDYPDEVDDL